MDKLNRLAEKWSVEKQPPGLNRHHIGHWVYMRSVIQKAQDALRLYDMPTLDRMLAQLIEEIGDG